jgi:hypothetical protein
VRPKLTPLNLKLRRLGYRVNRQQHWADLRQPHQHRLMAWHMAARFDQLDARQQFRTLTIPAITAALRIPAVAI